MCFSSQHCKWHQWIQTLSRPRNIKSLRSWPSFCDLFLQELNLDPLLGMIVWNYLYMKYLRVFLIHTWARIKTCGSLRVIHQPCRCTAPGPPSIFLSRTLQPCCQHSTISYDVCLVMKSETCTQVGNVLTADPFKSRSTGPGATLFNNHISRATSHSQQKFPSMRQLTSPADMLIYGFDFISISRLLSCKISATSHVLSYSKHTTHSLALQLVRRSYFIEFLDLYLPRTFSNQAICGISLICYILRPFALFK